MNEEQSSPEVIIICKDRPRSFCLNIGAFKALGEYYKIKLNKPDFNVLKDLDWGNGLSDLDDLTAVIWAGFFTDAKKDKDLEGNPDLWTIEKVEDVFPMLEIAQMQALIQDSLSRVFTPEQRAKMAEDAKLKEKELEQKKKEMAGS